MLAWEVKIFSKAKGFGGRWEGHERVSCFDICLKDFKMERIQKYHAHSIGLGCRLLAIPRI